jgi:hypothetical protein
MERANRLNMGTANCTGFDAEPPRSPLPACMEALTFYGYQQTSGRSL